MESVAFDWQGTRWQILPDQGALSLAAGGLYPLQRMNEVLGQAPDPWGIWIDAHEEPEILGDKASRAALMAIRFASWRDGRGYSLASVVRRQLAYKGPLLAFGDVRRDQLEQMSRCGFNLFLTAQGNLLESADVRHFSHHYQWSVDSTKPLFRTQRLE